MHIASETELLINAPEEILYCEYFTQAKQAIMLIKDTAKCLNPLSIKDNSGFVHSPDSWKEYTFVLFNLKSFNSNCRGETWTPEPLVSGTYLLKLTIWIIHSNSNGSASSIAGFNTKSCRSVHMHTTVEQSCMKKPIHMHHAATNIPTIHV